MFLHGLRLFGDSSVIPKPPFSSILRRPPRCIWPISSTVVVLGTEHDILGCLLMEEADKAKTENKITVRGNNRHRCIFWQAVCMLTIYSTALYHNGHMIISL